jgi:hypothetical protein
MTTRCSDSTGARVAGVTVHGSLARLAVAAWGLDWLRRGTGSVRYRLPAPEAEGGDTP